MQITCINPVQAHGAMTSQLWPQLKAMLTAGHRMVLELRQEKRSDAENRMLHAMLGHISKNIEWAGKKRDIDTWKRLLTAAWLRARGEHIEMLPALDGPAHPVHSTPPEFGTGRQAQQVPSGAGRCDGAGLARAGNQGHGEEARVAITTTGDGSAARVIARTAQAWEVIA